MICGRCGLKNDPQAHFCMKCGFALRESTKILTDDGTQVVSTEVAAPYPALELSLRIGDGMLLMPFHYKAEMVLGREQHSVTNTILDPGQHLYPAAKGLPMLLDTSLDFLDLTAYGADDGGVSRKHAVIRHEGQFVTVEDLGSRNGTHLNREKLIPGDKRRIKTGDLLFLGKLIVSIAFRSQAVVLVKNPSHDPSH
jgi:hypothetical protein